MTLRAVMLWNEPNNLSHWDYTLDPEWATYAQMVRWSAAELRREAPDLTVVLGGIAPIDPKFMDRMVNLHGLKGDVDAVAIHGFPFDWHLWPIDQWPDRVAEIRAVTDLPIWATEVGTSSFGCEEVQEIGLKKTIDLLPPLVEEIFWYSLFDLPHTRDATTRHKQAEGSSYYRHFYFGLLTADGVPKLALRHFPPEWGLVQWIHLGDHEQLDRTVSWLKRLGVRSLRTGLSWGDSYAPGGWEFFDQMMSALDPFDVTATLCFTPPSRGLRPDHTSPPADPGEFAYFCQQVARRYG
jgi:beta-xylosidase